MFKILGLQPRTVKILLTFLILAALYLLFRCFFIYTEDAFVKADTMTIASQVEGRVTEVLIKDNDPVTVGMPLIKIDPSSLGISQNIASKRLEESKRALPVLSAEIAAAKADINNEQAHLSFLQTTASRYLKLFNDGALARQTLDEINSQVAMSQATLKKNQANLQTLQESYLQQQATIASQEAELDLANYNYAQTTIYAQQAGTITSLNTYVGNYLNIGTPLFTIVSNNDWRVIANVKEFHLQNMHPGQKVIIYLSSHPFSFYTGTVTSIGRGVARSPTGEQPLQYIDPTVDWIRYDYRFPVTIHFNHPPKDLYMGADARVWIVK